MRAILTYHSIDDSGSVISVHPDAFKSQVEWLATGAVDVVSLEEICEVPAGKDAVALTFDDGFENFRTVAWPELKRHGLPATVFVVADFVGRLNTWEDTTGVMVPELELIGWEELGRLAEQGVHLGSHTRRHPDLSGVASDRLDEEIEGSAAIMRRELDVNPQSFAYPFGGHCAEAVRAVARVYRRACTTELRALDSSDRLELLPRLDMYYLRQPGRLERWGTERFRRKLAIHRRLRRLRSGSMGRRS